MTVQRPRTTLKPRRHKAGFTFIEVLVSVFIILVTVGVFIAAVRSISVTRESADDDIALTVASQKIDDLRAAAYAGLPPSGSFTDSRLSKLLNASSSIAVSAFNAKTKEVVVTITWRETQTATSTLTLTTLITQTGGL